MLIEDDSLDLIACCDPGYAIEFIDITGIVPLLISAVSVVVKESLIVLKLFLALNVADCSPSLDELPSFRRIGCFLKTKMNMKLVNRSIILDLIRITICYLLIPLFRL